MNELGFGINASTINVSTISIPDLPDPEDDGRILTFSKMGYATIGIDDITKQFVSFAKESKRPVLDGGAAFGAATIAALKTGATVIANDVDLIQLLYILKLNNLTQEEKKRLYFQSGALPYNVNFPLQSLSAIHLCRFMHFFTPEMIENMFSQAYNWLEPNGKFFLTTMSPFHHSVPGFAKTYEEKQQNGADWPGIITTFTEEFGEEHKGKSPSYLHTLDTCVLSRVAEKSKFAVETMLLFGGPEGKDYVGAVFVKQIPS